jgi:hypothetical protein
MKVDQYIKLWGEEHGYQSSNSRQTASVDDGKDKFDKKDEDTEDNNDMDVDDQDEEEDVDGNADGDESFIPEDKLDYETTSDKNVAMDDDDVVEGDDEETSSEVGEDEVGTVMEEKKANKVNAFETKGVNNYNDLVDFYNARGDCRVSRNYITVEGNSLGNWVHEQRHKFERGMYS